MADLEKNPEDVESTAHIKTIWYFTQPLLGWWPQFHTLCAMFSSIPILYFSSDRPGHPSSSLYSIPSALIRERMGKYLVCPKEFDQSGLWSNIFFGRDELGQVFKIYSNREGHQGTSARWLSGTLGPSLDSSSGKIMVVCNFLKTLDTLNLKHVSPHVHL